MQAYGVVLNVATLAAIGGIRPPAQLAVALLLAMAGGLATGVLLMRRGLVDDRIAHACTLALAAAGGAVLLFGGHS